MEIMRVSSFVLLVLASSSVPFPARAQNPSAAALYVAPGGNDQWSGRLPDANADRTDGPLATLAHAHDELRRLRKAADGNALPTHIYLRGGLHFIDAPLTLLPEDSGTPQAPMVFEAFRNEKPIVSGGRRLTGWKNVDGKWQLVLPDVKEQNGNFVQLFVGGERRPRPRLPKKGWFHVEADLPRAPDSPGPGFDRFQFRAGDLDPQWSNLGDVEVLGVHIWAMSRMRIKAIDAEKHVVAFTGSSPGTGDWARFAKGNRFAVENVREALDEPGQWYLDRPTGTLTYFPKPGEDPASTEVIAPRLEKLLIIRGDPAKKQWVQNIIVRGITFAHANWVTPPAGNSSSQAEAIIGAAIDCTGAQHCAFENCGVTLCGGYGIALGNGCRFNRIDDCELIDLGAGGIKLGSAAAPDATKPLDEIAEANKNIVRNCLIEGGGRMHPAAIGIWIGNSPANVIEHNEITDFYYTGISLGWSWGYNPNYARDNEIAWNRISKIGQGVLSDMGGIYTLGNGPGNVLHHNLIWDVESFGYGGWGIYFDEGSTGYVAENNVVHHVKSAGFHQHYGRENQVRNNIFALGRDAQLMRSRDESHISFTLERNIVYSAGAPILASLWEGKNYILDRNLYWDTTGRKTIFPGNRTLEAWQKETGHDLASRVADPLFVNPDAGDFTLRAGSPASQIGFQPIDLSKAGRLTPRRAPRRPIAPGFEAL
jgi:hypothetical protein